MRLSTLCRHPPLRAGSLQAGPGVFPDQVALKLGQGSAQVEGEPPGRSGGVQIFLQAATKPIQPLDDQRVAGIGEFQRGLELGPLVPGHRPAAGIGPDVPAAGRCQGIELQVVGLVAGTDARVANRHAPLSHKPFPVPTWNVDARVAFWNACGRGMVPAAQLRSRCSTEGRLRDGGIRSGRSCHSIPKAGSARPFGDLTLLRWCRLPRVHYQGRPALTPVHVSNPRAPLSGYRRGCRTGRTPCPCLGTGP